MTEENKNQNFSDSNTADQEGNVLNLFGNQNNEEIEHEGEIFTEKDTEEDDELTEEENQDQNLTDTPEIPTEPPKDEEISLRKSQLVLLKKLLENIKENNSRLLEIISGLVSSDDINNFSQNIDTPEELLEGAKIIEAEIERRRIIS